MQNIEIFTYHVKMLNRVVCKIFLNFFIMLNVKVCFMKKQSNSSLGKELRKCLITDIK